MNRLFLQFVAIRGISHIGKGPDMEESRQIGKMARAAKNRTAPFTRRPRLWYFCPIWLALAMSGCTSLP